MVEHTSQTPVGPITWRARNRDAPAEFASEEDRLRFLLLGARQAADAVPRLALAIASNSELARIVREGRNVTLAELERIEARAPERRRKKTEAARKARADVRRAEDDRLRKEIGRLQRLESLSDRNIAARLGVGRSRVKRLRGRRESGRD
jgi:hypothetical protein